MLVLKFEKTRKWLLQVQINGATYQKTLPFGQLAIDCVNTMLSGSDFDIFTSFYKNQVSEFRKKNADEAFLKIFEKTELALNDPTLMRSHFDLLSGCYSINENEIVELTKWLLRLSDIKKAKDYPALLTIYNEFFALYHCFSNDLAFSQHKENDALQELVLNALSRTGTVYMSVDNESEPEIAKIYTFNNYEEFDAAPLFAADFFELLFNQDVNLMVKRCTCGALFITSYHQATFCPDCKSKDENLYNFYSAQRSESRKLHKKILDLINNRATDIQIEALNKRYNNAPAPDGSATYHFRTESNYYDSIVSGKRPSTPKLDFYLDIDSEEQYLKWLEGIREIIKKAKTKNR